MKSDYHKSNVFTVCKRGGGGRFYYWCL